MGEGTGCIVLGKYKLTEKGKKEIEKEKRGHLYAISIKEPYGGMILNGEKTIETRTWKTDYRGELVICVSKKPVSKLAGLAICIANLVECRPMTEEDVEFAMCGVYPGAYSWVLQNVRKIEMFQVKGQLGLFNIDKEKIKIIS